MAFEGHALLARGALADVGQAVRGRLAAGSQARLAVYDERSGRPVDLDCSGGDPAFVNEPAEAGASGIELDAQGPRGPGRPKLGVVSREVSLLPRHWEWLAAQRGGASASLRRLVDAARKEGVAGQRVKDAVEVAHRFLWDLAGDLPDFEEATRALFAHDFAALERRTASWPAGVREQLARFLQPAHTPAQ